MAASNYQAEVNKSKKNKILILGAGSWQVPWLAKARELGFIVYATDWSETAEGRNIPHYFSPINLRDKEATLNYARQHKIDAIFTSADIGVQTAAYVAAHMGLPYHSEALAYCATNKFAMREKARNLGLGGPHYQLVDHVNDARIAADELGFPLIIKPVDNFSSKGVRIVNNQSELEQIFQHSLEFSFEKKVLLEEFMIGTEGSVEALIKDGIAHIMGISEKQKSPMPYRYDILLEYPGNYCSNQLKMIEVFIQTLVTGFEIQSGIIHVEIMITQDDVRLIEFAIRGCGSKIVTHLMPALTQYDVMAYVLWNAFGIRHPIQFSKNYCGLLQFIMLPKGRIKRIDGEESIKTMPGVLDFLIERKVGDVIGDIEDGRSRPGYLLAYSTKTEELQQIVQHALATMTVEYE